MKKKKKKTLALFVKRVILSAGAMLIFSVSFLCATHSLVYWCAYNNGKVAE